MRSAYHHGNLKETLISGMLSLLETNTLDQVSLRKLASHIGVTPTAVYNHFADKEALLAAVTIECLRQFSSYLDTHSRDCGSARESIYALGRAYYNFILQHPHYAQVLFEHSVPDEYISDELVATGMQAEQSVRKAVRRLLEENDIPLTEENEALGTFSCWSLAHGVTALSRKQVNHSACMIDRWPPQFAMTDDASVNYIFENMCDVLVQGIVASLKAKGNEKT